MGTLPEDDDRMERELASRDETARGEASNGNGYNVRPPFRPPRSPSDLHAIAHTSSVEAPDVSGRFVAS